MAEDTLLPTSSQLETIKRGVEFIVRTQEFQSGTVLAACSCGEWRVFPEPERTGKCPRGLPWLCMAPRGLPWHDDGGSE